jgi:hypothetical protein
MEEAMSSSGSWKVIIRRAAAVVWGVAIIGFVSTVVTANPVSADFGGCNENGGFGCASAHGAWEDKSCGGSGGGCQSCSESEPDVCFPDSEECHAGSCVLDGYKMLLE